jgi:hypothetical protein
LGFSRVSYPLSQGTKGGFEAKFSYSKTQKMAFAYLKHHLFSTPVLTLPDLQQLIDIEIDASNYAIDEVLTYHGHLVVYQNEALSDIVFNYPT